MPLMLVLLNILDVANKVIIGERSMKAKHVNIDDEMGYDLLFTNFYFLCPESNTWD